ncbi:DUF742 domain-containing protein [Streptacidiphilus sp. ASG 303]|uniref:DUF742 domain-containing protein n=1 Tax=Streptacidiphilus sp. ASG 303 TaxID=2896847 RepID=UPI001E64AFD7|nr:DUF742 domain-containing protein [Streptacidiphilus sp. ASG 303]MCD0483115.1 DUF742 domain-containing protein [Streptacidiphilus sp. ASG 303]
MTAARGADGPGAHWFEEEAGPLVRPYTFTRGRTRPAREHELELMSVVTPVPGAAAPVLDHARSSLLRLLGGTPRPVAELAADADLPLGVVRVLLGDLLDAGLVRVAPPPPRTGRPDAALLREVVEGLRRL